MRSRLTKTMESRGWGALNHLDRVVVFARTIGTTFTALLLELFLRLGIRESEQELDTVLGRHIVEFGEDIHRHLAGLKSRRVR
jgi:hypothetical protein